MSDSEGSDVEEVEDVEEGGGVKGSEDAGAVKDGLYDAAYFDSDDEAAPGACVCAAPRSRRLC